MTAAIENRGPQLLAVDILLLVTAWIAIVLRCHVRAFMVRAFGVDDWLMMTACISFTLYCSFSMAGVHYGTGRHRRDLAIRDYEKAMNCWWFCYLFYCTSMITSKLSIGWFLLRITVKKIHAWILYMAMFISIVAGVIFFFVTLFQCKPISYFWKKEGQVGRCINIDIITDLAYLYSAFSIVSDFTFAILPALLVWTLQLQRRQKYALMPLLAMGCVASSAVVARFPYLKNFSNPDFLWATLDIAIWSTVEQGLAITAASLATLRPLLQLYSHKLGFSTRPAELRPSNYGPATPPSSKALSSPLSSRRKGSQNELDAYDLSTFSRLEDPNAAEKERKGNPLSPFRSTFSREKKLSSSKTTTTTIGDNESEENLNDEEREAWERPPASFFLGEGR